MKNVVISTNYKPSGEVPGRYENGLFIPDNIISVEYDYDSRVDFQETIIENFQGELVVGFIGNSSNVDFSTGAFLDNFQADNEGIIQIVGMKDGVDITPYFPARMGSRIRIGEPEKLRVRYQVQKDGLIQLIAFTPGELSYDF